MLPVDPRELIDPSQCVVDFHRCIAAGLCEAAAGQFSFDAAYRYWCDVTISLGIGSPTQEEFRSTVMGVFRDRDIQSQLCEYLPGRLRYRVIGDVGSVVFEGEGLSRHSRTGVVTVVREDGRWKVRTFPGVFPGSLLKDAKQLAAQVRSAGSVEI